MSSIKMTKPTQTGMDDLIALMARMNPEKASGNQTSELKKNPEKAVNPEKASDSQTSGENKKAEKPAQLPIDHLIALMARREKKQTETLAKKAGDNQTSGEKNEERPLAMRKDEKANEGGDLGAMFAEWYAVQNGISNIREKVSRWKACRDRLLKSEPPVVTLVRKDDAKSKEITVTWPKEALDLKEDVVFKIGATFEISETYSPPADENGNSDCCMYYRTVERLFWKVGDEPLSDNQYLAQRSAEQFALTGADTVLKIVGEPIDIQIQAIAKDTGDIVNTFAYSPPKPPAVAATLLKTE